MIIIIIALAFALFITLIYLFACISSLHSINKQLIYIQEHDTNKLINVPVRNKYLLNMVMNVNNIIKKYHAHEVNYKNQDENLKMTIVNVTHDLRTPLTVAKGYTKLLTKETFDSETQQYINYIDKNLTRLKDQLQVLFEYAKIQMPVEVGTYTKIDLSQEVIESSLAFYDEFEKANIKVNLQVQPEVFFIADEQMVKRIIDNLLQNVIRHGKDEVTISLNKEADRIILQTDNLCANENVDVQKVFERFYTEDYSRSNKNTGLGLSIVKEFVTRLGGQVEAQLQDNRFILRISL